MLSKRYFSKQKQKKTNNVALKATPQKRPGKNRKVIVTAGPTVEYLDPVRYITNRSTGTMGYSIAKEFISAGFPVCIITGPVCVKKPHGAEVVEVSTAREMLEEVNKRKTLCRCLIMAAAVCDFRPQKTEKKKIKKNDLTGIKFIKNCDILMALRKDRGFVKIGFALETDSVRENGKKKLKAKGLDLLVANSVSENSDPFGNSVADYLLFSKNGEEKAFKRKNKTKIARIIFEEAKDLMRKDEYDK